MGTNPKLLSLGLPMGAAWHRLHAAPIHTALLLWKEQWNFWVHLVHLYQLYPKIRTIASRETNSGPTRVRA